MVTVFADLAPPPRGPFGIGTSEAALALALLMVAGALWFVFVRRRRRKPPPPAG